MTENSENSDLPDTADIDRPFDSAYLDDLDDSAYPAVLRLTSKSPETHRRQAIERSDQWMDGQSVPHVVNFEDPTELRALLTERRIDILGLVLTEAPQPIAEIAETIEADESTVIDDLEVLAAFDIIHFEWDEEQRTPYTPYERIEVTIELSPAHPYDAELPE